MKKLREITRKKIITYYLLAIVIPCIILGVLAFRGVKNDQALIERNKRRAYQESGQKISHEVETFLKSVEKKFVEIVQSVDLPGKKTFSHDTLSMFVKDYPVIEGVFFLSAKNDIILLDELLLYKPENSNRTQLIKDQEQINGIVEEGWKLEFLKKDYKKAIKYYTNILTTSGNNQAKGETYNAIVRIQKKLDKPQEALKTYKVLLESYPDIYIKGNIPLGMVSLLESSQIYLEMGKPEDCLETINALLSHIRDLSWSISYATYSNIISMINEILDLVDKNEGTEINKLLQKSENLTKRIRELEERTEYLLSIPILSNGNSSSAYLHHRYVYNTNGIPYYLFIDPVDRHGHWGLIYNQENLLKTVFSSSLQKIRNGMNFDWKIANNDGTALMHSKNTETITSPIKVNFSEALPSWTLFIYPKTEGLLTTIIETDKGIYFYIFLLIIILLALGLFFTLFNINNQLHLSKMKSNFISTISHEFKSPLTSIRQMSEMLNEERVPTKKRKQQYYGAILHETERLSHLIDNILDFSKMEIGKKRFHFEKGNIAKVSDDIVKSFKRLWKDKCFQINFSVPAAIPDSVFDKETIKQVLHNLIENACKYSGSSKKIDIRVTSTDSTIIIAVKDYGIGISKEEQDKIFTRFYRAGDELTQKVKGSGIGLTIVRQIVEAHKGKIKVSSNLGKGSLFRIELPINIMM